MGLLFFSVYNNIRNITEKNNQIEISVDGINYTTKTLHPGSYEIKNINEVIDNENIQFLPVDNLNRVKLVLKNNHSIRFTNKSFHNILGFEQQEYKISTQAERRANIQNNINTINVICNSINGGYFNNQQRNIIYSIPSFSVAIGYRIIEKPFQSIYLPLNTTELSNINLQIVDDYNNLIDFGGEEIIVQLHLKQI